MSLRKTIHNFAERYLDVQTDFGEEIACFCPFHHNVHTPAFYLNKTTGLWLCHNPQCGEHGSFSQLVKRLTGKTIPDVPISFEDLENAFNEEKITEDQWDEAMERISVNYEIPEEHDRLEYLYERGFDTETLKFFEIGFSQSKNRIVIPVRNENYKLIGFIGRTVDNSEPKYLYTTGFKKANVLFNLQNAKHYNTVYITEGSLDAIKLHQSGFPAVVATLGSNVTDNQIELINKYFNEIVILSDADEPGFKMRDGIIDRCPRKDLWVTQFPPGIKDPGEMREDQIRLTISNKENYLDYLWRNI